MQADDLRLLGIPRRRLIIATIYPHHDLEGKSLVGIGTPDPNPKHLTNWRLQFSLHFSKLVLWALQHNYVYIYIYIYIYVSCRKTMAASRPVLLPLAQLRRMHGL